MTEMENKMAMRQRATAGDANASNGSRRFPPEAYDYADEVTYEAAEALRKKVGIDFNSEEWEVIDGYGKREYA